MNLTARDALGPFFLRDMARLVGLPDDADLDAIGKAVQALAAARLAMQQENEELKAEIEAVWFGIEHGYEIESRAVITEESKTNGFKYPLAQAVHTIWKREPKVAAAEAAGTQLRQELEVLNRANNAAVYNQDKAREERDRAEHRYEQLRQDFQALPEQWLAIAKCEGPPQYAEAIGYCARDLADRLARQETP